MTTSFTTRAWSCTVRLVVDDARALKPASADLLWLLGCVDKTASRFRADSALSRANRNAGRPTPVPQLLVDLVEAALQAAVQTDGAVDPTVGPALTALGYDRDFAALPADGPAIAAAPLRRSYRDVRLDRGAGLLTVPLGSTLDLGATAKAYVADHAAQALHARYGTAVMVELGGDIAVAGHRPDGWCIEVAEREGGTGQLLLLRHGGLVTSTTTVRHWQRGGQPLHHIVDPRTGAPADGPWRTVSVSAPRALAANVASTAAIVLGDAALPWLTDRGIAARLVARDAAVTTTAGWPPARLRELAS
ncbi:FAD:protein FMN transferase [Jatrophihabitans sp.]|uniref:FAD:protein FMN transferase n=1 Tax=Jatrophihabitans sp. TaxID=1932789 RepID=UPI0030C6E8D9|nr:thiamine biosynthesis protein [Jatrophihabitans sp.]